MILKILYFSRFLYGIMCLIAIALFVAAIPMHFSREETFNAFMRTGEDLTSAVLGVIVFYFSHLSVVAYKNWISGEHGTTKDYLRKIVGVLYCTAFLDVLYLILRVGMNVPRKTPEDILRDNPSWQYYYELGPIVKGILSLVLPRPIGVSAVLLALFISMWVRQQEQEKY